MEVIILLHGVLSIIHKFVIFVTPVIFLLRCFIMILQNKDPLLRILVSSLTLSSSGENHTHINTHTHTYMECLAKSRMFLGVLCQKQVSSAGTSNYILQYLCGVVTCPCPWYLLLAQHSSYNLASARRNKDSIWTGWICTASIMDVIHLSKCWHHVDFASTIQCRT